MIQFIAASYKGVKPQRQKDVYRLLHIAFDHGYLFDADEIEYEWEKLNPGWPVLPPNPDEIWKILKKSLPAEAVKTQI